MILTFFTDRSSGFSPDADSAVLSFAALWFPRLEKFHSAEAPFMSCISGLSMVIPVTFSLREKISGHTSTPMPTERARTNGVAA
jgi:hypothetical protein